MFLSKGVKGRGKRLKKDNRNFIFLLHGGLIYLFIHTLKGGRREEGRMRERDRDTEAEKRETNTETETEIEAERDRDRESDKERQR